MSKATMTKIAAKTRLIDALAAAIRDANEAGLDVSEVLAALALTAAIRDASKAVLDTSEVLAALELIQNVLEND